MYLDSGKKSECFGCEGCVQICGKKALSVKEDEEGFRYPCLDEKACVKCGLCKKVCPFTNMPVKHSEEKYAFGGYSKNKRIRFQSTSGGAFSTIVNTYCDENYVIFGAEAKGVKVYHNYITNKANLDKFRKSKYSQSVIGSSYINVRRFLQEGKKVLFSGTPCQIAGLLSFLGDVDKSNLLTIEVICEGVPSPLYIRKMDRALKSKYGSPINKIDYRYTGRSLFNHGKWDFQKMRIEIESPKRGKRKVMSKDRWFNPFWSIWLQHLMSRPACYNCKFTSEDRVADISLGDLWGVHLYCPELYGNNGGASLIVCNSEKGKRVFKEAQKQMYGHQLNFKEALRYQSPMRKPIDSNERREECISDLRSDMDYDSINKKWAKHPTVRLLFQKYVWGNRQKVFLKSIINKSWQERKR